MRENRLSSSRQMLRSGTSSHAFEIAFRYSSLRRNSAPSPAPRRKLYRRARSRDAMAAGWTGIPPSRDVDLDDSLVFRRGAERKSAVRNRVTLRMDESDDRKWQYGLDRTRPHLLHFLFFMFALRCSDESRVTLSAKWHGHHALKTGSKTETP